LETIDGSAMAKASTSAPLPPPPTVAETQSTYASQLGSVPEFGSYGPVLNSSMKLVPLTESETEYFVTCVKHIFKEHIVFQFNVTNTLPETVLEGVSVVMQPTGEGLTEDFIIPIPSLAAGAGAQIVYVSFTRDSPEEYFVGGFGCTLKFVSKEIDPETGVAEETGYSDDYNLEEIEVTAGGDYILPSYCSFDAEWDGLAEGAEREEEFGLSAMGSIKGGCGWPSDEEAEIDRSWVASQPHARPWWRF
jgi:coatomer protein complex subunit gamma